MRWLSQVTSITLFNLRSMMQRKGSAAAAIFGIAGVVLVFVAVLSIAQGFRHAMTASGREDTAIVMRSGATSEMMSGLAREETRIIAETDGVARSSLGQVASPELFVIIDLPKRSTNTSANVPLRGVEEPAFEVRDGLQVVEGRSFAWGRNEVIVGVGAAREFAGLDLGGSLEVAGEQWAIVGIFEDGGGISESEIWTDARLLQSSYRRGDSFQAVYAKLESVDSFSEFSDELSTDPRVNVTATRQTDYYSEQSTMVTAIITGLGTLIAVLMGVGPDRIRGVGGYRRPHRRSGSLSRFRRFPRRHHQLPELQPGRVHISRYSRPTGSGRDPCRVHRAHRRPGPGDSRRTHAGGGRPPQGVRQLYPPP